MKHVVAFLLFVPMLSVVVVLAGVVAVLRLLEKGAGVLADLMVPAILALVEWADED